MQKPFNMMETNETHDTNPSHYEESKIMHHGNYNGLYDQAKPVENDAHGSHNFSGMQFNQTENDNLEEEDKTGEMEEEKDPLGLVSADTY